MYPKINCIAERIHLPSTIIKDNALLFECLRVIEFAYMRFNWSQRDESQAI